MGLRAAIWISVVALIAAAGLRVAGIFNEFWIDEIGYYQYTLKNGNRIAVVLARCSVDSDSR